jgi:hypothetical protein
MQARRHVPARMPRQDYPGFVPGSAGTEKCEMQEYVYKCKCSELTQLRKRDTPHKVCGPRHVRRLVKTTMSDPVGKSAINLSFVAIDWTRVCI